MKKEHQHKLSLRQIHTLSIYIADVAALLRPEAHPDCIANLSQPGPLSLLLLCMQHLTFIRRPTLPASILAVLLDRPVAVVALLCVDTDIEPGVFFVELLEIHGSADHHAIGHILRQLLLLFVCLDTNRYRDSRS